MITNYKNFKIKSNFFGVKPSSWDKTNSNHHIVTVINKDTKLSIDFDFWCSIAQPEFKNDYDLLSAFHCFVSDGLSGNDSFEDFCGNFGYDDDSRKAEKVWQECKKAYDDFLIIFDGDIYDFINELQEVAG